MKREIKFRGISERTGEFVYGSLFFADTGLTIIENGGSDMSDFHFVKPDTVGQFTGMKDKNDVDIYEGDCLKICAGYASKVEFKDAMFVSVYDHWEDPETIPLIDAIGKETEVFGNINQD